MESIPAKRGQQVPKTCDGNKRAVSGASVAEPGRQGGLLVLWPV